MYPIDVAFTRYVYIRQRNEHYFVILEMKRNKLLAKTNSTIFSIKRQIEDFISIHINQRKLRNCRVDPEHFSHPLIFSWNKRETYGESQTRVSRRGGDLSSRVYVNDTRPPRAHAHRTPVSPHVRVVPGSKRIFGKGWKGLPARAYGFRVS